MSTDLAPEPAADGDAVFRNFQRHNLARAAEHFDLTIDGPASFGWRLRSIGAPATRTNDDYWLRVVSEEPQWARGHTWTGNLDANTVTGIAKPRVLDVLEWSEHDWRNQRAEVLTKLAGSPCSPTDVLRQSPAVSSTWWTTLQRSLGRLAETRTDRVHADQARVTARIHERFGEAVDTAVDTWTTAHGDFHWANLMAPDLGVLDWELWGRAPTGIDAASLLCHSLLVPETADRIRARFDGVLNTRAGRIAQLYTAARLLRRIDGGDYPELAQPLRQLTHTLLTTDRI